MIYCTKCGTLQEPGSRFCTGCGKLVRAPSTSTTTAPPEASSTTPTARRYEPDVTSYPPQPKAGTASLQAPRWSQGNDDDWETDTPTRSRSRRPLVVALTALVLLLGGTGVTAWLTLAQGTDTPTLPSPSPTPHQSQAEISTSYTAYPPSDVNPEDAALDQLTQQIALDLPQVRSQLAETWVPQLSSKQPGLVVDDVSYDYTDILNDHVALRSTYSARLVWSGDWSSFRENDFYITVAAVSFSTPEEANAWCDMQDIDSDNCFAKRLSTIAGPDGSTINRR